MRWDAYVMGWCKMNDTGAVMQHGAATDLLTRHQKENHLPLDLGWPWVRETSRSKATDKGTPPVKMTLWKCFLIWPLELSEWRNLGCLNCEFRDWPLGRWCLAWLLPFIGSGLVSFSSVSQRLGSSLSPDGYWVRCHFENITEMLSKKKELEKEDAAPEVPLGSSPTDRQAVWLRLMPL